MTEDDKVRIAWIRSREQAATPGPWVQTYNASNHKPCDIADKSERGYAMIVRHTGNTVEPWVMWFGGNGDFVLEARQDIPWLLNKVEELERSVRALRELAAEAITSFENYGAHFHWCDALTVATDKDLACNCGYISQWNSLKAEQKQFEAYG